MKKILFFFVLIAFGSCQDEEPFIVPQQPCNHNNVLPALESLGFELSVIDMAEHNVGFKEIQFVSNTVGFMYATKNAGGYIEILKTTNGGDTWNSLNVDLKTHPYGIRFKNEQVGFLTGHSSGSAVLYKTDDGGITWERKTFSEYQGNFVGSNFDKDGNAYTTFTTLDGVRKLLKSADDGDTWTEILDNPNIKHSIDYSLTMYDDYFLILGENGKIFKVDFDGNLLKTMETNDEYISDIQVFDENTIITTSFSSLLKTIDGGETWTDISYNNSKHVIAGFSSKEEGLVIRSKGSCPTDYILSYDAFAYTEDGGQSWKETGVTVNMTYRFENSYVLPNGDFLMLGFREMLRIKKL